MFSATEPEWFQHNLLLISSLTSLAAVFWLLGTHMLCLPLTSPKKGT